MRNRGLRAFILIACLVAWLAPAAAICAAPTPPPAPSVWFFGKIEDPRLQKLVSELKVVIHELWQMLWSFDWIKHPRLFYRHLKTLFVTWYELITELFAVLMEYIMQLEREINAGKCRDRACNQTGA